MPYILNHNEPKEKVDYVKLIYQSLQLRLINPKFDGDLFFKQFKLQLNVNLLSDRAPRALTIDSWVEIFLFVWH